jgi:hypothetical protein
MKMALPGSITTISAIMAFSVGALAQVPMSEKSSISPVAHHVTALMLRRRTNKQRIEKASR